MLITALCAMEWLLSPNVLTSSWHTLVLAPFLSISSTLLGVIWVACRDIQSRNQAPSSRKLASPDINK